LHIKKYLGYNISIFYFLQMNKRNGLANLFTNLIKNKIKFNNMKKLTTRGFTLIELLVVIAIIGILSSIVLASLSSARDKGTDSAIKADLANMRAQGELYYANWNNYGALAGAFAPATCPTSGTASTTGNLFGVVSTGYGLADMITGLKGKLGSGVVTCSTAANATAWAVSAPIKSGGSWCVDSSGKSVAGAAGANGICP
jgi:prepilin-type N-terminal cleavage/methylation domain-containing protein